MSLGSELQVYSYEYLLALALSQVPNTVDKREGSIIYDALAPACYVLAEYFMELYKFGQETSALTATGEWLEMRCKEQGISRNEATPAVKKAIFTKEDGTPAAASLGNRFSTISEEAPLYYVITDVYRNESGNVVEGAYQATCESPGVEGHQYTGNIIPLDYLPQIATAVLADTIIPGTNAETDDELRSRYFETINSKTFAGNIAHYKEMLLSITGVGAVQIYPVWNGGGTVKVSIVDSTLLPVSNDFLNIVQEKIDPDAIEGYSGTGLGQAPIDHRVTVVTPTAVPLTISGTVVLYGGYALPQVQEDVKNALESYLATLRTSWGESSSLNEYSLTIYNAQIIRTILSVPGVANVTNVKVNESSEDIVLSENSTTQEIPTLQEVVLNV